MPPNYQVAPGRGAPVSDPARWRLNDRTGSETGAPLALVQMRHIDEAKWPPEGTKIRFRFTEANKENEDTKKILSRRYQ